MSDLSSFLSTRNSAWSPALWDGLIEALQARLAPLEEQLNIQREVTDAIIARGLMVIEQGLSPIIDQTGEIVDNATDDLEAKLARFEHKVTGGTVIAYSASSVTLTASATVSLVIAQADREFFAATPYLILSRAATVANWAVAKVNTYNRTTGALSVTLENVTGAGGPFTDWVLTSLPGVTFLQQSLYTQTAAAALTVAADKDAVSSAKDQAVAAKDTAVTARGEAVTAKNSAQQALADLRQAVAPPLATPSAPVLGQLWYDGSTTRVYDGSAFVPTVTVSLGGLRMEQGEFGASPDGVVTVGGGFTNVMAFQNGALLVEGDGYEIDGDDVVFAAPVEGDRFDVWGYKATSAADFYTKAQVNSLIDASVTPYLAKSGGDLTGLVRAAAGFGIVFMPGSAPSPLQDGHVWREAAAMKARVGATTREFVFADLAQTLSRKTLLAPVITGYTETVVTASGTSFTINLDNGTIFNLTTTGNTTIPLPTPVAGKSFQVVVNYGGAHLLTWSGGARRWGEGEVPEPTSVAGKRDVFVFTCADGTTWDAVRAIGNS